MNRILFKARWFPKGRRSGSSSRSQISLGPEEAALIADLGRCCFSETGPLQGMEPHPKINGNYRPWCHSPFLLQQMNAGTAWKWLGFGQGG